MNSFEKLQNVDRDFLTRIVAPDREGPLTLRLQRRAFGIYLVLCAVGLLPWLTGASASWQAAGVGMLWPGAGFLAVGGWWLLLIPLTLVLFGLALFLWFASAMLVAPIIIWLGSAALAGALAGESVSSVGIFVAIAAAVLFRFRGQIKKRDKMRAAVAKREQRNEYLPRAIDALPEALSAARPLPAERELSAEQAAALRYVFDRALQPVGQLEGFDHIEQFQPSALRYQLNQLGYTLALAQCQYTPNFHGYLNQAQRNLIEQSLEGKVWNYWRWERLWGKFSLNDNPVDYDNIMLTGFLGLQVALYTGNTGDLRYAQPGGLSFKRDGKVIHIHDLHSFVGSLTKNFDENPFCLFPCEPNWIYTFCNSRGMTTLLACDRIFGTDNSRQRLPRYLQQFDAEFISPDGTGLAFKSQLTGFNIGMSGSGDESQVLPFSPIDSKRSLRCWAISRQETVDFSSGKPVLKLDGKGFDFGNYKRGYTWALAQTLGCAREMGDEVIAKAALEILDELCELDTSNGRHQWKGSTMACASAIMAFLMQRDDWRDTVLNGPTAEALRGPILTNIKYPNVLVAKARSNDGDDLDLVLYPGKNSGSQTITIERLQPQRNYQITGGGNVQQMIADDRGTATFAVHLDNRTPIRIQPC
ncbi:MAG: hypothetical protein ABW049_02770 [Spongiibacteraceae bacterium]